MIQISSKIQLEGLWEQFDREGYCIADDLYSEDELREMEAFFEEFKRTGPAIFDGGKDGGKSYDEVNPAERQVRVMHPHRHSKKVMDWFTHPKVAEALRVLLGKPAFGAQTMYYYKPPGAKGQGMHQDNFYLVATPATCIAAWTPIDSADEENGCLYVAPGSHRSKILCPESGEARWMGYGDSHISKFPRDAKPMAVPVRRGQTLFFGGNLIHGSGPNRSKNRFRRTFIGHYVDEATETLGRFYHPIVNMRQETVSSVKVYEGGGPCGDDWRGGLH